MVRGQALVAGQLVVGEASGGSVSIASRGFTGEDGSPAVWGAVSSTYTVSMLTTGLLSGKYLVLG